MPKTLTVQQARTNVVRFTNALHEMGFKVFVNHYRVHSKNGELFCFDATTKQKNVATKDNLPVFEPITKAKQNGPRLHANITPKGGSTVVTVVPFTIEEMQKNAGLPVGSSCDVYARYGYDAVADVDQLRFSENVPCSHRDSFVRSIGAAIGIERVFNRVKEQIKKNKDCKKKNCDGNGKCGCRNG